ncbi:hypothetical protein KIPB_006359 [Kipferlia bialata]|uniref:Uncharacterized protein n=1 Tax=Kipferlia bialata TaxID=797122 RepID=A0A9K3CWX9_9EUKA|nr:hypothetical protein KIPB_006359 [Kipferlia bialata]|eukprot:g6359.t1
MHDGSVIHMPADRFETEADTETSLDLSVIGEGICDPFMPIKTPKAKAEGERERLFAKAKAEGERESHAHPVCGVGLLPEPFSQAPSALNMPRYMSVGSPMGLRIDVPFPDDVSDCETPLSLFPLPSVGPGHMQYSSVDAYRKKPKGPTERTVFKRYTPLSQREGEGEGEYSPMSHEGEGEGEREREEADESEPLVPQVVATHPSLPFRYTRDGHRRGSSSIPSSARTDSHGPSTWRGESNSPRSARSQISSVDTVDEEEIGGRGGGAERDVCLFVVPSPKERERERERQREREREIDIEDTPTSRPQYCIDQSNAVEGLKTEIQQLKQHIALIESNQGQIMQMLHTLLKKNA